MDGSRKLLKGREQMTDFAAKHTEIGAIRANLILALDGTILETDEGITAISGYSAREMADKFQNRMSYVVFVDDFEAFPSDYNRARFSGEYFETEFRVLKKDGGKADVFMYGTFTKHVVYGEVIRCVCVDVSGQRQSIQTLDALRNDLRKAEEKYRILSELQCGICFEYDFDSDNLFFFGKNDERLSEAELIECFSDGMYEDTRLSDEGKTTIRKFIENPGEKEFEFKRIEDNGEFGYWRVSTKVVYNAAGNPMCALGMINNIDEEKREEARQEEEAMCDQLTGLYKKEVVRKMAENCIAEDPGKRHAFILVDMDGLSDVNDRYGNKIGNALLKSVSENLKGMFRSSDILGRIGGDKFLLFMRDTSSMSTVLEKVTELEDAFSGSYLSGNENHRVTCSIGISRYPVDGRSFVELMFYADKALHFTKAKGGNGYQFYEKKLPDVTGDFRTPEEVYDSYVIDEQSCDSTPKGMDSELVGFTLDIFNESRDSEGAICMILDRIGKNFDVTNVSILECNEDDTRLGLTYFWDYRSKCEKIREYYGIGYENYPGYTDCFDEDGIYIIEDRPGDTHFSKEFREATGIKSIAQAAIYKEGEFKGCVSLHDTRRFHDWTKDELLEFSTVAKIIATYLLRIRANDEVRSQMYRIENYDPLTGLPTLSRFKKNAVEYLKNHPDRRFAVVYSDISNFKYVNDTLGYELGDHVLKEFSKLIKENYEDETVVGRVSSDNFIGLLECESEDKLRARVLEINNEFNREQKKSNLNRNLVVISGASVIKNNRNDIMSAIDNANIARKSAKGNMKTVCRFFDESMERKLNKEMDIVTNMERALLEKEFVVYLQPKFDLQNNVMVGAEALIRWLKKDKSIVKPDDFIPLFEKNGFVVNVDFFVYEEVCKCVRRWLDEGKAVVPISINVSRLHLNDEHFIENLIELVGSYNIPPKLLELEITESVFLNNTEVAMEMIRKLHKHGFGVSIDDFGAGYSSLNLLKDMETDVLKLDKEFFRSGALRKEDKIILSNIINMAKQLNMKVLSEGVETREQSDFLKEVSCDMVQGFLFAKPMPIAVFESVMNRMPKNLIDSSVGGYVPQMPDMAVNK